MAHNLIVDEDYIRDESKNLRNALVSLDSAITYYQAILTTVTRSGIKDGATAEALKAFSRMVRRLKGDMKLAGENVYSLMNNYLLAIDEADKYLF